MLRRPNVFPRHEELRHRIHSSHRKPHGGPARRRPLLWDACAFAHERAHGDAADHQSLAKKSAPPGSTEAASSSRSQHAPTALNGGQNKRTQACPCDRGEAARRGLRSHLWNGCACVSQRRRGLLCRWPGRSRRKARNLLRNFLRWLNCLRHGLGSPWPPASCKTVSSSSVTGKMPGANGAGKRARQARPREARPRPQHAATPECARPCARWANFAPRNGQVS